MPATKPTLINTWGNANTSSPDMVTPSYIDTGFPAPSGGVPVKPPRGYINWMFNFLTNAVRYFMQRGISNWDASETGYTVGSVVRYSTGGTIAMDGILYQLLGTATTGTAPQVDPGNWIPLLRRDAYGMPYGGYSEWFEMWAVFGTWVNVGGAGFQTGVNRWNLKVTGTDTSASVGMASFGITGSLNTPLDPGLAPNWAHSGALQMFVGRDLGAFCRVADIVPSTVLDDNVIVSLETNMSIHDVTDAFWLFGFSNNEEINAINDGAFFWVRPGHSFWECRSILNGTPIDIVTSVPFSSYVPHRLRIVCRGASMGVGARQIQFYIDDVWVGASNASLPFADAVGGGSSAGANGALRTILGGQRTTAGSGSWPNFFGTIRYSQRFRTL